MHSQASLNFDSHIIDVLEMLGLVFVEQLLEPFYFDFPLLELLAEHRDVLRIYDALVLQLFISDFKPGQGLVKAVNFVVLRDDELRGLLVGEYFCLEAGL